MYEPISTAFFPRYHAFSDHEPDMIPRIASKCSGLGRCKAVAVR